MNKKESVSFSLEKGKSCVESRDSSNEEDMVTWVQDKMLAYVSKVEKSWHRHQQYDGFSLQ